MVDGKKESWHGTIVPKGHPLSIVAAVMFHLRVRDGFDVVPQRSTHQLITLNTRNFKTA